MENNQRASMPEQQTNNHNVNRQQTAENSSGNPVRNETEQSTGTPTDGTDNKPEDTTEGQ